MATIGLKNAPWKEWQDVLLLDFYRRSPQATHTDGHATCKALAKQVGRTPSAVEKRLRNLKFADTGAGLAHGAKQLRDLLSKLNREAGKVEAEQVRKERGLPPLC